MEAPNLRLSDHWQHSNPNANAFDAFGQEWTIVQDQLPQGIFTTTPPSKTQTPTRKRKSVDQHAGSSRQHAQPHAREEYHAQATQAPQPHLVTQNATPDRGDINAFIKEALATALQGKEELRMIVEQHESVAHNNRRDCVGERWHNGKCP